MYLQKLDLSGDGIGPEISSAVQKIFETAKTPIEWDPVDVTPVRGRDGNMHIPSKCNHDWQQKLRP